MKSDDLPSTKTMAMSVDVRSKLLNYQMVNPSDYFKYIYIYIIYHISYSFISLFHPIISPYPLRAFAELGIWAIALAEHAQFASGTRRCVILARDARVFYGGEMVKIWWNIQVEPMLPL